jgi:hypothetical protein
MTATLLVPKLIVPNVILTVNKDGTGSYTDATGDITDAWVWAGTTRPGGYWPLSVNIGKGPKIVGPGTVGWIRQEGYLAGYKVFDQHPWEDTTDGLWKAGGLTTIFSSWIPSSQILAGPFGIQSGAIKAGTSLDRAVVKVLRRKLTKADRLDLDRRVKFLWGRPLI